MEDNKDLFNDVSEDELLHYGTPRHSGRYPWGSGEDPYQHSEDFLARYDELKKQGLSESDISKSLGMSSTQLRAKKSIALEERRKLIVDRVKSLKADSKSNVDIANELGLAGESTVRSLLNADSESRMTKAKKTADNLRKLCDERGMIDVGVGVERELGISKEKMNEALEILKVEGYEVYGGRVPQATNAGKMTTIKVLCPPGTEHKEIYNYDKIHTITDYISRDGGDTLEPGFVYPKSIDSKRVAIRYAEDGGVDKDGLVEIRRGVPDLSLGESNYAQVRILVDNSRYIKGMAAYSDNLPDGVDIVFNTNKKKSVDKMDVLKKIKNDPENPFGSSIKEHGGQSYYIDPKTGKKELSAINKRAEEGDWDEWSHNLPSQFLSKQSMPLIKKQLNLAASDKEDEFNDIMALTNPTVKKAMLESFAEDCDSAAVHLKAAALPGQRYQVILPLTSIKDTEVYAPNFDDGSRVALIRYPHGGTFEIPILTVNNRNKEGREILTTTPDDAIGINSKVAERLSGADFDGDTVMVIPLNDKIKITSTPPLKGLEGFDPKLAYGSDQDPVIDKNGNEHYFRNGHEYKIMGEKYKQNQMGVVSNLITDMTLGGASEEELARAVRHSMVVIDAAKHKLDYKQSEKDNGISQLRKKYQSHIGPDGNEHEGASTLISKAKGKQVVNERKEGAYFTKEGNIQVKLIDEKNQIFLDEKTGETYGRGEARILPADPKTGEKVYRETGREYTKAEYIDSNGNKKEATVIAKDGKLYYKGEDGKYLEVTAEKLYTKKATQDSTKMAEAKDAKTLSSGTPQEEAYAEYANKMKALANASRKEALSLKGNPYSPSAKATYSEEVQSLNYKLNQAKLNAPRERQAQTLASSIVKAKLQEEPEMDNEHKKKISQQALSKARLKFGAHRTAIEITDKEWEAIQAGAISPSRLEEIIANCDTDRLRELATPRKQQTVSNTKISRMKNMAKSGYTTAEIAKALGYSSSTVTKYLSSK